MAATLFPRWPVLLVDDDEHVLKSFEISLRLANINNIVCCQDSRKLIGILEEMNASAVLLDLSMPHIPGEKLLAEISLHFPGVPVIIATGANDVATAVACMKAGAFDYMVKPVEERRLQSGVGRAIELRELQQENAKLVANIYSDRLDEPQAFEAIITRNTIMRSLFQYIETIAKTLRPVLITGETGVGKELFAKAIHDLSGRAGRLVPVNVAGLDDAVFSDTLFGHVKGAFTGADAHRGGLIERAEGGTLFLDEIGDLTPFSQIKLLRLLQEREYLPLGSDLPRQSSARIVLATNQNLDQLQKEGKFRKDLYFRLQTHHVHVPSLRERLDDIPCLLEHFVKQAALALNIPKPAVPKELSLLMRTYQFPGNVRELECLVFDAVSRNESRTLSLEVFRQYLNKQQAQGHELTPDLTENTAVFETAERLPTLKEAAAILIAEALKRANGNQGIAAGLLGISRTSLNKRLGKEKGREKGCEQARS